MRKAPEIPQDVFFEKPKATARKTAKRQAVKQSKRQKVQVTIYLSDEAIKSLEKARFELLTKHDVKAPKSAIVEYAIGQAVGDIAAMAEAFERQASGVRSEESE